MNIVNAPVTHIDPSNKLTPRSTPTFSEEKQTKSSEQSQSSEVSTLSKAIDSTFENLSAQPDVDMEMVTRVKAAIANGEFQIDVDATVNALIELHK